MRTSKSSLLSEEIRMPEGAGGQGIAEIHDFFSREGLQQAATHDLRTRLARELHDGVLQSLTAAVARLEAVSLLIDTNPDIAKARLRDVQEMISEEQRALRIWAERLKSGQPSMSCSGTDLANALGILQQRITMQWGLRVEINIDLRDTMLRGLGDEIYRIVQEALTNAGRHARASLARVDISLGRGPNPMRIAIADDGCGFPLSGRFDLTQLTARRLGPRSLLERVAALGGDLMLTSSLSGSRLEIALPLQYSGKNEARRSARM